MTSLSEKTGSSSGLSLAVRLQKHSSEAWSELVDLYGPLVDSWCRRAGLAEAARADIGQEVFLAVHRGIARFDPHQPGATFRGWLWTITKNAVLQSLRRGEVAAIGGSTAQARLNDVPDPWCEDTSEHPPSSAEDTAGLLRRALAQIQPTVEPHTWQAFWRTAVLGQSAPEVAQDLGLTPTAVRQAKSRLLRRLRLQLGEG